MKRERTWRREAKWRGVHYRKDYDQHVSIKSIEHKTSLHAPRERRHESARAGRCSREDLQGFPGSFQELGWGCGGGFSVSGFQRAGGERKKNTETKVGRGP